MKTISTNQIIARYPRTLKPYSKNIKNGMNAVKALHGPDENLVYKIAKEDDGNFTVTIRKMGLKNYLTSLIKKSKIQEPIKKNDCEKGPNNAFFKAFEKLYLKFSGEAN